MTRLRTCRSAAAAWSSALVQPDLGQLGDVQRLRRLWSILIIWSQPPGAQPSWNFSIVSSVKPAVQVFERRPHPSSIGQDDVIEGDRCSRTSRSRALWASSRPRSLVDLDAGLRRQLLSASGKVKLSRRMTKLKCRHPSPQPKQCHVSRAGVTTKLGFLAVERAEPLQDRAGLAQLHLLATTSTIDSLLLTSAATP